MIMDVRLHKRIKRYVAFTYVPDLTGGQLRQYKDVRHVDTELITTTAAAGMSGQAIKEPECFSDQPSPF